MIKLILVFLSKFSSVPIIILFSLLTLTGFSQQKKDIILPPGFTADQILGLKDANGNRIIPPEDSISDAFQTSNFVGLNTGDSYGITVSSAGDVNGDGYDDIIIGAPYNDGIAANSGRAYIYFGGLIVNTLADIILSGEAANNYFGYSVSSAGDVNNDGYSDVIVGAYAYNSNLGRAYIYFGGAGMNITADVIMTGDSAGISFGISVSDAGDVNNDGYSDVIVGASQYSSGKGKAQIFLGGTSMNNVPDLTLTGETVSSLFGISVSSAGDVNNDGYDDVITGASGYNSTTGRTYIYYGGASMDNTVDLIMTGEASNSNFGYSVSLAGDVNGDGNCDVIVGSHTFGTNSGRAYIYFGSPVMNDVTDIILNGFGDSWFGRSVSSAGDINNDGYIDVIVGEYRYNSMAGRAYIFYGGANMDVVADFKIEGEASTNYLGNSVSSAGDVNGDGYSDVIAGAYGYNSNTGKAYLYMYGMSGTLNYDLVMTGETGGNDFGFSVASAGDVNGDGYCDVIAGARGYSSTTGRAYIYYGGSSMNNTADVVFTGEAANNYFGCSVSSAGDVNGDGYADVIVGAYQYSTYRGKAYIYFGGASMNNTVDVSMIGEASGNYFGYSVSSAGDVNGDGYSDVIIGAPNINTQTGKAYLYYGGASMNNAVDLTFNGAAITDQFGYSVASSGDVNGDGFNDIIIGAIGYNSSVGRAYIYYGGTAIDNTADVIMTGDTPGYFGYSVAAAGDFNGDGYSDALVGATGIGRAYIFYGGISMNNTYDVSMTGEGSWNTGYSVSTAGDFNGDGFSDVMISTPGYPPNGKVYIYFGGGPGLNNYPDIMMSELFIFGNSVAAAGDLNGDGSSDLIIGAYGYSSYTGRSYVYFTNSPDVHPHILSVRDVPDDQGGFVYVKWARSGYDIPVSGVITSYLIERSTLSGMNDILWVSAGTVPATRHPIYEFEANTPTDSGNWNYAFNYKVTALTQDPIVFWSSNIISGYSVDNLAPLTPQNLAAILNVSTARLNWIANPENDLRQYIIYRNKILSGTSNTLSYIDNTILPDSTYTYRIAAEDIHGNISGLSDSAVVTYTVSTIDIKIIPEGFYNASTNRLYIRDTVKAYLCSNTSPYYPVDSASAIIDSVTFQGVFRFYIAVSDTYYIEIKHRNTIETWSRSGGEQFSSGTMMNYDFTNSISNAFGNNMKQIDEMPIRYAIYSGDVNQDGAVDITDGTLIENDAFNFITGYIVTDLNGDGAVDIADQTIADNNAFNFVAKVTP